MARDALGMLSEGTRELQLAGTCGGTAAARELGVKLMEAEARLSQLREADLSDNGLTEVGSERMPHLLP